MKTKTYRFPLRWLGIIGGYLGITIGLILLVWSVLQWIGGGDSGNSQAVNLLFSGVPILVGCAAVNLYPDVEVYEDGLRVQVFGFQWMSIPWGDLIAMEELRSPYQSGSSRGMVVRVHGLTFIHLLIVASLTKETTRGFVISSSIRGYDDLVEIIRQKLEEKAV